ncbi:hypothetical protein FIBSPDRAFT_66033 [Athelia psychrophila]|uniref:Uncharacterized protein n=1 Tax=Athelia psychrophila TaxID=1759441 RepID=A0A166ESH3_9AGAM|nr:hypothetical protein FIBSPDRAFT_66033 [Fibularhizoctonia sp. CBS 109695]
MNRCPIELWETIFSYSCIDGGNTGCSLSLTSRAFHAASRRFRYHSVALKGLPSTLKFAQMLSEYPQTANNQICIRHLYMTNNRPDDSRDGPGKIPSKALSGPTLASLTRILSIFHRGTNHASITDVVQNALSADPCQSDEGLLCNALHAILCKAAPTLITLSLSISAGFLEPEIPPLPALVELTLHYSSSWSTGKALGALTPMPALRKLDLLGNSCHESPEDVLVHAAEIAPNLTHICFPVLRTSTFQGISHWLYLGEAMRERASPLSLYVQLDPWAEMLDVISSRGDWEHMYEDVKSEVEKNLDHVVLCARTKPIADCHYEQEQNWRDRMHGLGGRWAGAAVADLQNIE